MKKQTLIFTRAFFDGIDAASVVTFKSNAEKPIEKIIKAVSEWITETKEGTEAFSYSCADFNIGDLSNASETIVPYLEKNGIFNLQITGLAYDDMLNFDMHLFDLTPEQEEEILEN